MENIVIITCDDESIDLALAEAALVTEVQSSLELAPGVLFVVCAATFGEIAERWRTSPPIFVRHICPVQLVQPLRGDADDVEMLREVVTRSLAPVLADDLPFSVQTRIFGELPYKPFDVNSALSELLHTVTGALVDVRNPQQVVSALCIKLTGARAPQLAARLNLPAAQSSFGLLGLSFVSENVSNWAGGMRRFAREYGQVSRAEFKLLEAIEIFGLQLKPRGVALDLGASPGGWTRVLRERDQYVTAVDPGDLDERVASDKGVRHKRMTAEEYLRDEPDKFDIIVNDMRMDARDSARLMVDYVRTLYPHGMAIMTLKLPHAKRAPVIDHAFSLLRQVYTIGGARQLFHNRSEITLLLRPMRKR